MGYNNFELNSEDASTIDDLITRLMTAKMEDPTKVESPFAPLVHVSVSLDEIAFVTRLAVHAFAKQKSLLRIDRNHLPINVVGDMHGQFRDLRIILNRCGNPEHTSYLFLGDYVDRGLQGVETVILMLSLKVRYPHKVYLLRGNHEDCNTSTTYGFYDECKEKYASNGDKVWTRFIHCFNWMPVAALIHDRILCMHGGLSPHIDSFASIEKLTRPSIIPPYGLMCDLLWADPDNKYHGWALSSRGISFSFDETLVEKFCDQFNVDLIIRAHQINTEMFRNGYRFFAGGRLVTIFSAPNYLNLNNDSCVIHISQELAVRFIVFRPRRNASLLKLLSQKGAEGTAAILADS